MTEHRNEFQNLRAGARVTLRDWRGDTVTGAAFLSAAGQWLMKTDTGGVFPVTPRELVAVKDGAAKYFTRLRDGQRVIIIDWEGHPVRGIAQCNRAGLWECKTADGARWLIEPYRLSLIEEG